MFQGRSPLFVLLAALCVTSAIVEWGCTAEQPTPVGPAVTKNNTVGKFDQSTSSVTTGFPDLTVDTVRLAGSVKFSSKVFKSTDCAVVESCITVGKRNLMRFDVATPNVGTADVILGDPQAHSDWFVYSPCHGHFHLKNFSIYRLRNSNGVVVSGHKQAFCLEDVANYWPGYPSHGYTCTNQGISVGWGDVYGRYLDCQWLDVTNVPSGKYVLEVVINRSRVINEGADVSPDSVDVPVTIP